MRKYLLLSAVVFLLLCNSIKTSAQKVTPQDAMAQVAKGKPFTLVILRKGETPLPADKTVMSEMQMTHLVNLFQMEKDGKISIFGPVLKDSSMEGLIIFNTTDRLAIGKELIADPFVKAGHMKFDMYDWFTIPGQKIKE